MLKEHGRWLSNTYNPLLPNARDMAHYSLNAVGDPAKRDEEWRVYLAWISRNIIGPPKATKDGTAEQLAGMGMVGVYAP